MNLHVPSLGLCNYLVPWQHSCHLLLLAQHQINVIKSIRNRETAMRKGTVIIIKMSTPALICTSCLRHGLFLNIVHVMTLVLECKLTNGFGSSGMLYVPATLYPTFLLANSNIRQELERISIPTQP
jgi:hypothetical protein